MKTRCGSKPQAIPERTNQTQPHPSPPSTGNVQIEWLEKTASAASPGSVAEITDEAIQGLRKARDILQGMSINEALELKEIMVQELDYTLVCDLLNNDTFKLKACRMGHGMNMVEAQALFWFEDDNWKLQLYPQVEAKMAKTRFEFFKSLGNNCPMGCAGGFEGMRSHGNEVLVNVNLSSVGTRGAHEIQLLRKTTEKWEVVWVPSPENYPYQGFVSVDLPVDGIEHFTIVYQDGSKQKWHRVEDRYQPANDS